MIIRRQTSTVTIGNVKIGSKYPIVVQAMTDTDTADVEKTADQVIDLAKAGAEIVRITVNNESAAKAVARIRDTITTKYKKDIPLVGCFHYNGHTLLEKYPDCAKNLAKLRINPGNVGFGYKRDKNFEQIIEIALRENKPIRIGANWGSLDQSLMADIMNDNSKLAIPASAHEVLLRTLIESAIQSANYARNLGMSEDSIIVSAKVSRVQDLVKVYQEIAVRTRYPLHLGLTEAGPGISGITSSSAALAILLQQGIGDTIRCSLTPTPHSFRTDEVEVCTNLLQSLGIRAYAPRISACPGCGRTTSTKFQELAYEIQGFIKNNMEEWKSRYPGVENLNIAVMGCIVNGPGESKHANIGISLPGNGEEMVAPVYIDGQKFVILRGENLSYQFQNIITDYIRSKYIPD